jgi:TorA maturation chaperone TorD
MELFRALAVLAEPPTKETTRLADVLGMRKAPPTADEHTELFVFQLYPYASVYLGAEGMMGGQARDLLAGFWRALGGTPPAEADHLSIMLALYARLSELADEEGEEAAARGSGWRGARRAFLWEHLLSWLPVYLSKLADIAPPFYREWGEVLTAALLDEASSVGEQDALPLGLREPLALVDPRAADAGAEGFWQSVLTPARFGGILTRADLSRAARSLGAGLRMGERKFVLKALFAQDAPGVFDWLAEEASLWRSRHERYGAGLGAIMGVWQERAESASSLLKELRREAREV